MTFFKKTLLFLLISLAIFALLCVALTVSKRNSSLFYTVSDASFIVSALNISVGVLGLAANQGFFSVFSFAAKKCMERIMHPKNPTGEMRSYYEYRKEKEAGKRFSVLHFFIVGALFLLISILCALL